jgi:hypothetical protein
MTSLSSQSGTSEEQLPTRRLIGQALLDALWSKANAAGQSPQDLAHRLEITYPYLMALTRGQRPMYRLDRTILVRMAEFLEISVARVFLLAGLLRGEDFSCDSETADDLDGLLVEIHSHPDWRGHAPSLDDWRNSPGAIRQFVGKLYQHAKSSTC